MGFEFILEGTAKAVTLILSGDPYILSVTKVQMLVSGTAVLLTSITAIPLAAFISLHRFKGKELIKSMINTAMGLPPVAVGLLVFLFLTRRGPFGFLDLLYTPGAMIIAQYILAFPIVCGVTISALESVPKSIKEMAISLGGTKIDMALVLMREVKYGILTAILAGFGRAIAEVGAILTVGGNIVHLMSTPRGYVPVSYTRTLTTAITVEARQGEIASAIAFGIILISLAFVINLLVIIIGRR